MKIKFNDIIKSVIYPTLTFLIGAFIMYYFTENARASGEIVTTVQKNQTDIIEVNRCLKSKADKIYVDEKLDSQKKMIQTIENRQLKFDEKFDDMYSKIIDLWKSRNQ